MSIEKHLLLGYKKDLPEDIAKTIADYLMEKQEQKEESIEDKLMGIFLEERQKERSDIMRMIRAQIACFRYSPYMDVIKNTFKGLKANGQLESIIDALMLNTSFTFKQYLKLYNNDREMINNFIRYMIHCECYYCWFRPNYPA